MVVEVGFIGSILTILTSLFAFIRWGRGPVRWLLNQTIGRFRAWVEAPLPQIQALQSQVAELSKTQAKEAPQGEYPIDTTPTVEQRLAEMEEALRQSNQRVTDQRNELMGKFEELQKKNAALTAQLEEAGSVEAKRKRALEQSQKRLHRLTPDEQAILRPYIAIPTRTQDLEFGEGAVQVLMKANILELGSTPYNDSGGSGVE